MNAKELLSLSNIVETEQERTDIMIDNIFTNAIAQLMETGGIIICDVGVLHAHRLAAKIHHKLNTNQKIYQDFDITINALFLYSDYLEDKLENIISNDKILKLEDRAEIKDLYHTIPFLMLHCIEIKDTSDFYNSTLENIIISCVEDFKNENPLHQFSRVS